MAATQAPGIVPFGSGESKPLYADFARLLPAEAVLSESGNDSLATSPTVTISPEIPTPPSDAEIQGTRVVFRLTKPPALLPGEPPYVVTILCNDDQGNTHEIKGLLQV